MATLKRESAKESVVSNFSFWTLKYCFETMEWIRGMGQNGEVRGLNAESFASYLAA